MSKAIFVLKMVSLYGLFNVFYGGVPKSSQQKKSTLWSSSLVAFIYVVRVLLYDAIKTGNPLKVPKCEIFHLFDFNDFYVIKSL
jgi:hypothetical protein